eukprot:7369861-Alexandrium_andersonii.AAC.1
MSRDRFAPAVLFPRRTKWSTDHRTRFQVRQVQEPWCNGGAETLEQGRQAQGCLQNRASDGRCSEQKACQGGRQPRQLAADADARQRQECVAHQQVQLTWHGAGGRA